MFFAPIAHRTNLSMASKEEVVQPVNNKLHNTLGSSGERCGDLVGSSTTDVRERSFSVVETS